MTITATIAANKALACRFLDLVAAHDIDGLCGLIFPGWTMHGGPPNLPSGPAGRSVPVVRRARPSRSRW